MPTSETPNQRFKVIWVSQAELEMLALMNIDICQLCCFNPVGDCLAKKREVFISLNHEYLSCGTTGAPDWVMNAYIQDTQHTD